MLHGKPVREEVTLSSGRTGRTVQLSVNYDNAVAAVERSLRSGSERAGRLVQRFVVTRVCSVCHGTRLRPEALTSLLGGRNLAVATLVGVFDRLLEAGATIIVIDHDLDLLAAADHLIDMGPDGGRVVAAGAPEDVASAPGSVTGPWLAEQFGLLEHADGR